MGAIGDRYGNERLYILRDAGHHRSAAGDIDRLDTVLHFLKFVHEGREYLLQLQLNGLRQLFGRDDDLSTYLRRGRHPQTDGFGHKSRCRASVLLLEHLRRRKTQALLLQHPGDMISAFRHHFVEQILSCFIDREAGGLRPHIEYCAAVVQDMVTVAGGKSRQEALRTHKSMLYTSSCLRESFLQLGINRFTAIEGDIMRLE